jgi:SPP1 family predicted phage head-tail adaptor
MRAGKLRHRVTVQSPAGTRDAVGERQTTWTDVAANVPASIEPLAAREQFLAAQAQASTTHRVRLRYSSDLSALNASWRIKFGDRVLVIDGVRNIEERNMEFELLCTEGLREE